MPSPISVARKVSLCVRLAGADKRQVSEWWRKCWSSLPGLTDLRAEKDVSVRSNLSRVNKGFGYSWNSRLPVCQRRKHKFGHEFDEVGDLWGRKLFVHYKQDTPLCRAGSTGICKQAKKRKVSIPPIDNFVVGEPVREVNCFCTAELTSIITDGQNEPASGTKHILTAWNITLHQYYATSPLKQLPYILMSYVHADINDVYTQISC